MIYVILHSFPTLLPSIQSLGHLQVSLFPLRKSVRYVKSGENKAKSENSAFSRVNCSLKTKSKQKSECMIFKVDFLGFQNIESDFLQHLQLSHNGSIFEHHFLTKNSEFFALGSSPLLRKSPKLEIFLKNLIRQTCCPIFSLIGAFLAIV